MVWTICRQSTSLDAWEIPIGMSSEVSCQGIALPTYLSRAPNVIGINNKGDANILKERPLWDYRCVLCDQYYISRAGHKSLFSLSTSDILQTAQGYKGGLQKRNPQNSLMQWQLCSRLEFWVHLVHQGGLSEYRESPECAKGDFEARSPLPVPQNLAKLLCRPTHCCTLIG